MTLKDIFEPVAARVATVLVLVLLLASWATPAMAQEDVRAGAPPNGASLAGRLLVATPGLRDPNFHHTVIYMVSHDEDGAMGVIINRLAAVGPLAGVMGALGIDADPGVGEVRIFAGGPVQPNVAVILHSTDYTITDTVVVNGEIGVTAHREILAAMSRGEGPAERLLAFGYAGWGPGQLEGELEANAWYVVTTNSRFVFDKAFETKWQRAIDLRGLDL